MVEVNESKIFCQTRAGRKNGLEGLERDAMQQRVCTHTCTKKKTRGLNGGKYKDESWGVRSVTWKRVHVPTK